jgi:hypothetical protein
MSSVPRFTTVTLCELVAASRGLSRIYKPILIDWLWLIQFGIQANLPKMRRLRNANAALFLPCFDHEPTVCVFLGISRANVEASLPSPSHQLPPSRGSSFQFSEEDTPSVKQFMHEKSPQTDVERVACLAYYFAKYRDTPHVKTKDITELNKESAHRPFSNTAMAVDNATKTGYLVPSIKGSKQISAYGERFVEALPDRETAKEIMASARARRRSKPGKKVTGDAA